MLVSMNTWMLLGKAVWIRMKSFQTKCNSWKLTMCTYFANIHGIKYQPNVCTWVLIVKRRDVISWSICRYWMTKFILISVLVILVTISIESGCVENENINRINSSKTGKLTNKVSDIYFWYYKCINQDIKLPTRDSVSLIMLPCLLG